MPPLLFSILEVVMAPALNSSALGVRISGTQSINQSKSLINSCQTATEHIL